MALIPSRFGKHDQIASETGEQRKNAVVIKGAENDDSPPKILEFERFGGVENFNPDKIGKVAAKKKSKQKRLPLSMARFFKEVPLTDEQKAQIEADLKRLIESWKQNRSPLEAMLARFNDLAEGVTEYTDFPWPGASNLHIPLTEIHLNGFHSAVRQTMFKNENLWLAEYEGDDEEILDVSVRMENSLNFKCRTEIPVASAFSDLTYLAARDGTALAQVQWMEDKERAHQFKAFNSIEEFQEAYPSPESGDISTEKYSSILDQLAGGEEVVLEVEEDIVRYAGPVISSIEMNDFVMAPITAIQTRFAKFVGKRFTWRLTIFMANSFIVPARSRVRR